MWEIAGAEQIDRDKLRTALRRLGNEYIFHLLYDAIELLPPDRLQLRRTRNPAGSTQAI